MGEDTDILSVLYCDLRQNGEQRRVLAIRPYKHKEKLSPNKLIIFMSLSCPLLIPSPTFPFQQPLVLNHL